MSRSRRRDWISFRYSSISSSPDLDIVLIGLEANDLLLAKNIEQTGKEFVIVFLFKNIRVLKLDEIFQVAVGQGYIGDRQDNFVFDGRGLVNGRLEFCRLGIDFCIGPKKRRKQKKRTIFYSSFGIISQIRREFNGIAT